MGIIDSTIHTAKCSCGNAESVKILQHGSSYGASWQVGKQMKNFKLTWGEEGVTGPKITQAICSSCGAVAKIHIS